MPPRRRFRRRGKTSRERSGRPSPRPAFLADRGSRPNLAGPRQEQPRLPGDVSTDAGRRGGVHHHPRTLRGRRGPVSARGAASRRVHRLGSRLLRALDAHGRGAGDLGSPHREPGRGRAEPAPDPRHRRRGGAPVPHGLGAGRGHRGQQPRRTRGQGGRVRAHGGADASQSPPRHRRQPAAGALGVVVLDTDRRKDAAGDRRRQHRRGGRSTLPDARDAGARREPAWPTHSMRSTRCTPPADWTICSRGRTSCSSRRRSRPRPATCSTPAGRRS